MKKYTTPEITLVSFTPDETIAAVATTGSNVHNDVELAW